MSSSEPTGNPANEQPRSGHSQSLTPSQLGSTAPPTTLSERIEARRRDPEFQKRLKQNLKRHQKLLDRLADC